MKAVLRKICLLLSLMAFPLAVLAVDREASPPSRETLLESHDRELSRLLASPPQTDRVEDHLAWQKEIESRKIVREIALLEDEGGVRETRAIQRDKSALRVIQGRRER